MLTRRALLHGAAGLGLSRGAGRAAGGGLKEHAAAHRILYGAAASYEALARDDEYARAFAAECGILVPENALKWGPLRPTPERYNWEPADTLARFADNNSLKLRGHTLVWHRQLPPWFAATVNRQNARAQLEQHIAAVAGRYRGQMHSWDVVNEAIDLQDKRDDGLRRTPWLDLLGPDYLEIAFRAAKQADPGAMLVYNDYGVDYDQPDQAAKRAAILKLLRRLRQGAPLDAFGCQAHLAAANPNFRHEVLRGFFDEVAGLGLKILITELDVKDNELAEDFGERDAAVARVYESYLEAALGCRAVIAVLTWGLSDRYTWLAPQTVRASGTGGRVLPLDREFRRKPAWEATARAFDRRP